MNEEIYNQFSEKYNKLFIEGIRKFNKAAQKADENYCCFYPSFGIDGKSCEFIIYGQAIKGWQPQFKTTDNIDDDAFLKTSIQYSNSFYSDKEKGNHSPLNWVNVRWSPNIYKQLKGNEQEFYSDKYFGTYYAFRSFFWNVTYKLIARYYGLHENDHTWVKKIIWSNLYKIAPAERTNPSDEECKWQQEKSIELVEKEIEEINPRYCIVLTNDDWWRPFREKLGTKRIAAFEDNEYIESYEQYPKIQTKVIVTKRPYVGGKSNDCVDEILKLI